MILRVLPSISTITSQAGPNARRLSSIQECQRRRIGNPCFYFVVSKSGWRRVQQLHRSGESQVAPVILEQQVESPERRRRITDSESDVEAMETELVAVAAELVAGTGSELMITWHGSRSSHYAVPRFEYRALHTLPADSIYPLSCTRSFIRSGPAIRPTTINPRVHRRK